MDRRTSLAAIGALPLPTRPLLYVDSNEEAETQTLACSPDEFVISQRGRRSLPVTWSPDENLRKQNYHKSTKKSVIPPATKMGSALRSAAYKRLLGPEDGFDSKSRNAKKSNSADMMTTRSNNKRVSFTPEKLDFTDMSTPLKFKLLSVEKQHIKKLVFNLNSDVDNSPKSHVSGPRKRVLDNGGDSSVSTVKRLKS